MLIDTIAAISTSPNIGGIGIIRISGNKSFKIISKIFKPLKKIDFNNIRTYTIKYGNIVDNEGKIIDEVLVSFFKAPNTYTTEDICEINCHGGIVTLKNVLNIVIENGARPAEPGEFTKRAFLGGRIDLTQAEAVIDIINSKSKKSADESLKQLEGYLSIKIKEIRNLLINITVDIEANIDYPEFDIEEVTKNKVLEVLKISKEKLLKLVMSFDNGKILREGLKTVIIGKPNVGKSSLLNILIKEEKAIVTDVPGTTRDIIEEYINVKGIPVKLMDTAGIRATTDTVENIGVRKSLKNAEESDFIIAVFDNSRELDKEDFKIIEVIKDKNAIIALNKTDLETKIDIGILNELNKPIISISALNISGIDELEEKIASIFELSNIETDNDVIITNVRHKYLLNKCLEYVEKAIDSVEKDIPVDIVSVDIKESISQLGEITGESVSEDIIHGIFAKFCVGK